MMGLYPKFFEAMLQGVPQGKTSKRFIVDPGNGDDDADGNFGSPLATVTEAYSRCTEGHHDVVFLLANETTGANNRLSAKLLWDKDYTHLIGLSAKTLVGQRARLFQLSTATALSPLVEFRSDGCVVRDLYLFQGVADNTSLIDVLVSGQRNHFERVHFAGGGHATQAVDGGAALELSGSENLFEDCTVGVDTAAQGAGWTCLLYPAGAGAARNTFRRCQFLLWASNAGASWVRLLANDSIDRAQVFDHCWFINLSATTLTQSFNIAAGFDPANKRFLLRQPLMIGAGKWDNGDTGAVYGDAAAITGSDTVGLVKQMIT